MNNKQLELLYRSFDAELSEQEQRELDQALKNSSRLREEKLRIAGMRETVRSARADRFRPFFSARVMHRLHSENKQEDFFRSLVWSFRLVVVLGSFLVMILIGHNAWTAHSLSVDSVLAVPQTNLENTWSLDILVEEGR